MNVHKNLGINCIANAYRCILRIKVAKSSQNSRGHISFLAFWHQLGQSEIRYLLKTSYPPLEINVFSTNAIYIL